MEHAFRNYRRVRLTEKGKPLVAFSVKLGKKKESLPLNAAETIDVVTEIGRKIQKKIIYLKSSPPFKKNEKVAKAIFYIGKKQVGSTFLLSGKNIKKTGWSIFSIFRKS